MIIIGIIGLLSAGKGATAQYIIEKHHASRYGFSDSLRDITRRLHLAENRKNLQNLSTILRQEFGEDILANAMLEDIKNDTHDYIVVEGIRREADIKHLALLPGFHLIGIEADINVRYKRVTTRAQNTDDKVKSFDEFVEDHKQEPEMAIVPLMLKSNYMIDNNGDIEKLHAQIDEIIKKL